MEIKTDLLRLPDAQPVFDIESQGDRELKDLLEIRPPKEAAKAPPTLAFDRKREVEIDWNWKEIGKQSVNAIRAHFEKSWGFAPEPWEEFAKRLAEVIQKTVPAAQPNKPVRVAFRTEFPSGKPVPATAVQVTDEFVIREGARGRWYRLIAVEGMKLGEADFASRDAYESAWKDKIEGIELVFDSAQEAQTFYTDFEEIDLRPAPILRRYKELAFQYQLAKGALAAAEKKVDPVTNLLIDGIVTKTSDIRELERFQNWIRQLRLAEYDASRRIERLASDAARLGYKLDTATGKLYTMQKRTAQWTATVRFRPVWFLPFVWVQVRRPVEQIVEEAVEVDINKNRLAEKQKTWLGEGKHVHVFEQRPSGFLTADGVTSLREIMSRCGQDEAFRRTCVVVLPVYEESLTGERMLAKYSIFVRPLPGIVPVMPPRLSLTESLTYRLAWQGSQLGELASTINLAPGEERQVTITKQFEQETTVTRTSSSIFDISRTESNDLATEMENQMRQEQEQSSNLQFSTKASGGWGPFSAEATASGGTNSSLKNMSQAISKVAKTASQSISQQNRQEVSTTASSRTRITNTDETVAKIRNINQGRSLNLMFHRLYNKYEGGLFLEDLRFDLISGVEMIVGSGVHELRSYGITDLSRVIDQFAESGMTPDEQRGRLAESLFESISNLLRKEYARSHRRSSQKAMLATGLTEGPTVVEAQSEPTSVGKLYLPEDSEVGASVTAAGTPAGAGAVTAAAEKSKNAIDTRIKRLSHRLQQRIIDSDDPIDKQELFVMAPGLYLDAVVGARPGTEPYSEAMRAEEIRMRQAEVFVKASEGLYQQSVANRLARDNGNATNFLTGVLPDPDRKRLTLAVEVPLIAADEWYLMVDGKRKEKVRSIDSSRRIVEFSWNEPQSWMQSDDLLSHIALVREPGEIILHAAPAATH